MRYIGVDGCHAGWFSVIFVEPDRWYTAVYSDIADLWQDNADASLILIDMPIGVLDDGTDRTCDYEVRRLIGKRKSSVFPMPCRAALSVANYQEASRINYDTTGKKLSREMFNIMPKIRQLNDFLAVNPTASNHIKETHPELCFSGLNGGKPMVHAKKKERDPAFSERLSIVESYYPQALELIENTLETYSRNDVAGDDILDALALCITASVGEPRLTVISSIPACDSHGLPMQMVYYLKKG